MSDDVKAYEGPKGNVDWFTRDRFGLFIHWGLYAMGARHEWLMHREKIDVETYEQKYFARFDPDLYDPARWAEAAAAAGMKYFVITTKHHEGFCLWDSALTDYKAPNTPAGRDLLRPMVDAFRGRGLRVGFYHSLIDWHHPQYVIDPYVGPYCEREDRDALNRGRDQMKYADYLHGQVRELLTNYGQIDVLWFDYSYPKPDGSGKGRADWRSEELVRLVRELQPGILLNDRLDLPGSGDFLTPEQVQPRGPVLLDGRPVPWEACQTFSGSWGYHRDEASWRDADELLRTLIDCVSKGGNLLLNVGPTGRGEFDGRALARLRDMGAWMARHGKAIYGCTSAPEGFQAPEHCALTYHPGRNRLYVHILDWPYKHLFLDGPSFARRVKYAQLLHDGSEVDVKGIAAWQEKWTAGEGERLVITLPQNRPDVAIPVVELFLDA